MTNALHFFGQKSWSDLIESSEKDVIDKVFDKWDDWSAYAISSLFS